MACQLQFYSFQTSYQPTTSQPAASRHFNTVDRNLKSPLFFKSTHDPPGGEGAGAARDQDFYGWSRTFKSAPASQKFYAHSVHSLNFGLVY